MESNIVQDFQNLRVFSNRNINRMDELVQDLTNALEETSKVSRTGSNQENNITSGAVGRRQHKRRRGTRRAAANMYWKRGTISEASESSIDEAIRDYIDNSVVTHSDSDDLALAYPKHRLMVPMSEPIPAVESDSFTENLSPLRPQRRRRRYKHMAVDSLQSVGQLDVSAAANKNSSSKSSSGTIATPIVVPATRSHPPETRQMTRQQSAGATSSHPTSSTGCSRSSSSQNVVPGKRKRSSKSRSEGVTLSNRRGAASDKDSIDLDSMEVASTSQESSSLSSSEFDSDVYINGDEGREADDEQSDFYHEPGPTEGIPEFVKWWDNEGAMDGEGAACKQEFDTILSGALAHMPSASQRSFRHRVEKMMAQAENGREIRIGRRKLKGKIPHYTMKRFLQERESWNVMQGGCHFSPGASWNSGYSSQSGDYKRLRQTPPLPDAADEGFVGEHAIPIPESNIGNKMLQTMGWIPGSGLGAEGDGRKDPVVAYRRRGRKGLGYETQSDT